MLYASTTPPRTMKASLRPSLGTYSRMMGYLSRWVVAKKSRSQNSGPTAKDGHVKAGSEATGGEMKLTSNPSNDIDGDNRKDAFHRAGEESEEQLSYRGSVGFAGRETCSEQTHQYDIPPKW